MGIGIERDCLQKIREAEWKIPDAYFFTNEVYSEIKTNLIRMCSTSTQNTGVIITSVLLCIQLYKHPLADDYVFSFSRSSFAHINEEFNLYSNNINK